MEYNFSFDFSNFQFEADKFQELHKAKKFFYNIFFGDSNTIDWLFLLERFYQNNESFLGFEFQQENTVNIFGYLSNNIELFPKCSKKVKNKEFIKIKNDLSAISDFFSLDNKNDNEIEEIKKNYLVDQFSYLERQDERFDIYEKIIKKSVSYILQPYLFDYLKFLKNEKDSINDVSFKLNEYEIKLINDNYKNDNYLENSHITEKISQEFKLIEQQFHFLFMSYLFNEDVNVSSIFYNPDSFFSFYSYDSQNKIIMAYTPVNNNHKSFEYKQEFVHQFGQGQEPNKDNLFNAIRNHNSFSLNSKNNSFIYFEKDNNFIEYSNGKNETDLDNFIKLLNTFNEKKILDKSFNNIFQQNKHRL